MCDSVRLLYFTFLLYVAAGGSQGGDPCLPVPIAILVWEPITALRAAVGVEAVPTAHAVAMALKALVHLARRQIEANRARQGVHVYPVPYGRAAALRGDRTRVPMQ